MCLALFVYSWAYTWDIRGTGDRCHCDFLIEGYTAPSLYNREKLLNKTKEKENEKINTDTYPLKLLKIVLFSLAPPLA